MRYPRAKQRALITEVAAQGPKAGLADTERLVGSLHGELAFYQDPAVGMAHLDQLRTMARRLPGHFIEANLAAWLALADRLEDAQAEMDRVLAGVLAGSGHGSWVRRRCRYQPAPGGPDRWRT